MDNLLAKFTAGITCLSDAPTDAVIWRDVFCHEGGESECAEGTAEQLATKVIALGWVVDNPEAKPELFNFKLSQVRRNQTANG